jgi:peroxiredoxin
MSDERFYIDCEFDGHDGPLLSLAIVKYDGRGIHIATTAEAKDPWVLANVIPLIDRHECRMAVRCLPNEVGAVIRTFIDCEEPVIVADSPVDIGRFCRALSTGVDGQWVSAEYPRMTFEVRNVNCYPTTLQGAVQHNAWWDAMALRAALKEIDND